MLRAFLGGGLRREGDRGRGRGRPSAAQGPAAARALGQPGAGERDSAHSYYSMKMSY